MNGDLSFFWMSSFMDALDFCNLWIQKKCKLSDSQAGFLWIRYFPLWTLCLEELFPVLCDWFHGVWITLSFLFFYSFDRWSNCIKSAQGIHDVYKAITLSFLLKEICQFANRESICVVCYTVYSYALLKVLYVLFNCGSTWIMYSLFAAE